MRILDGETRSARARIAVLGTLAVLMLIPAFLLAPPLGLLAHLAAVLIGLIGGSLWGWATYERRYQTGLVALWKDWMEAASGSETLAECHRKVMGRSGRNLPWLYGAGLTVFWTAEIGLLMLAIVGASNPLVALPVIVANGLLIGAVLGHSLKGMRWSRSLGDATGEMVASGEVGLWGTR